MTGSDAPTGVHRPGERDHVSGGVDAEHRAVRHACRKLGSHLPIATADVQDALITVEPKPIKESQRERVLRV